MFKNLQAVQIRELGIWDLGRVDSGTIYFFFAARVETQISGHEPVQCNEAIGTVGVRSSTVWLAFASHELVVLCL